MAKSKAKTGNSFKISPDLVKSASETANTVTFDDHTLMQIDEKATILPNQEFSEDEIKEAVKEIVDYFESLPPEPDERILNIIEKQTEKLRKKTESFTIQQQEFEVADKKFKLAKRALRKAKEHKLDPEKIALIKFEKQQAKIERKQLKRLLNQEKQNLKNIRKIIRLLQLTA